ncbi:barstar family protein [Achromobacter sp. GG226]|uniref:barstar family protein n=1 Tax=Verticiella alkaliphila TaxID=2779529 RepID=UPI001C0B9441|nr:barstar family protein [Verticiella sp. GG226]
MTITHDSLQALIQQGGMLQTHPREPLAAAAEALGYVVFDVDCSRAKSKSAVLRAIASAVDYPEFFGSNLDALLDCLTATVLDAQRPGALVLLVGINAEEPGVGEHVDDILTTFSDAAEYVRDNGRALAFVQVDGGAALND